MSETMECEYCGEPAKWIVSVCVKIEEIETGALIVHPSDGYEEANMTDLLCDKCAKEKGYFNDGAIPKVRCSKCGSDAVDVDDGVTTCHNCGYVKQ